MLRILRRDDYPDLYRWVHCSHKVPYEREAGRSGSKKVMTERSEGVGPQAKDCRQPPEAGKGKKEPLP